MDVHISKAGSWQRGTISIRSSGRESAHSNPSSLSRLTSAATREFTNADVDAFTRELEKFRPRHPHESVGARRRCDLAKASYHSIREKIISDWKRDGEKFTL